ncbi:MAG: PRC-barrel domain-containing protein [Phycisphaerales bacterium]|jgi:sporulation protein YlmC with PRC-barrel domain
MKFKLYSHVFGAMSLAAFAGSALPAAAQTITAPAHGPVTGMTSPDFRTADWMTDREVVNNKGEEIAEVSDFLLDRGSGQIEYVIIKTGTILGMGGRDVAIPFASFRWESDGKNRLILASTIEQLKEYPEYTKERWEAMKEPRQAGKDQAGKETMSPQFGQESHSIKDPYSGGLNAAKTIHVEGKVTKVDRVRTSSFGEQVEMTVSLADGTTRRVALGPAWFVRANLASPMRGDTVSVDAMELPRDPEQLLVATQLKTGNRELHLRDTDGSAAWVLDSTQIGSKNATSLYSRYLVLGKLSGMKIECRGDDLGKVHEIIVERRSGDIAFVSIDPNQNFLGIGDTKHLIPWSVVGVTLDGTMQIDASKEMVLASSETPADLADLGSSSRAEKCYKAFDVGMPTFAAPTQSPDMMPAGSTAWSTKGSIIQSLQPSSAKQAEGKVTESTEVKFGNGIPSARAITIKTDGINNSDVILLGPMMYMDNQVPQFKVGEWIKADVCRVMIDGQPYWMAKTLEYKGSRTVLIDSSNAPAWAQQK